MKKKDRTNGEEWAYGAVKRDRQTRGKAQAQKGGTLEVRNRRRGRVKNTPSWEHNLSPSLAAETASSTEISSAQFTLIH